MKNCKICEYLNSKIETKIYFENKDWIVLDCKVCGHPIVIYKEHVKDCECWVCVENIENKCRFLFGKDIEFMEKKIKEHYHFYVVEKEDG